MRSLCVLRGTVVRVWAPLCVYADIGLLPRLQAVAEACGGPSPERPARVSSSSSYWIVSLRPILGCKERRRIMIFTTINALIDRQLHRHVDGRSNLILYRTLYSFYSSTEISLRFPPTLVVHRPDSINRPRSLAATLPAD